MAKIHSRFGEYCFQVVHHLARFTNGICCINIAGGGVYGNLARYKKHVAKLNGLVVRTNGRRGTAGIDNCFFHVQMYIKFKARGI